MFGNSQTLHILTFFCVFSMFEDAFTMSRIRDTATHNNGRNMNTNNPIQLLQRFHTALFDDNNNRAT